MKIKNVRVFLVVIMVISIWSCIPNSSEPPLQPTPPAHNTPQTRPSEPIPGKSQKDSLETIQKQVLQVVRNFYQAIGEKNCAKAIQMRPGYTQEQCRKIDDVNIKDKDVSYVSSGDNASVVLLQTSYKRNKKPEEFNGYVALVKENGKWVIANDSFKQGMAYQQYAQYLHERFNITVYRNEMGTEKPESAQAVESQDSEQVRTFGSPAILNSCWTQTELDGSPEDKKVHRPIKNPYLGSPLITKPRKNPAVEPKLRNSIRYVTPAHNKKIVALTFDLCERTKERTGYDAAIVNYLRKNGIKATFYAGGKWMYSHPDKAMQLMADPLFEIGNHAWTHGNMRVLKGKEMENQILWTQGQYEVLRNQLKYTLESQECSVPLTEVENEINKIPPTLLTFRFPYGTCSTESLKALAKYGLPAIQWDVVTADPSPKQSSKAIAKTILREVKPGSIIIAHANGRGYNTARALPLFIPELKNLNYQFVTVSELLKSGKVVTTKTCYELEPGDNKRYDKLFKKGTE